VALVARLAGSYGSRAGGGGSIDAPKVRRNLAFYVGLNEPGDNLVASLFSLNLPSAFVLPFFPFYLSVLLSFFYSPANAQRFVEAWRHEILALTSRGSLVRVVSHATATATTTTTTTRTATSESTSAAGIKPGYSFLSPRILLDSSTPSSTYSSYHTFTVRFYILPQDPPDLDFSFFTLEEYVRGGILKLCIHRQGILSLFARSTPRHGHIDNIKY
jgi:hypothetical protein